MTAPRRPSRADARRAGLWILLTAAGLAVPSGLTGCASSASSAGPTATDDAALSPTAADATDPDSPFAKLRALAARDARPRRDLEPPTPALAPIAEGDPAYAKATRPLADLTPESLAGNDAEPDAEPETDNSRANTDTEPGPAPDNATDTDPAEALRLYAEARLRLADDENTRAIGLLERATALDPDAPRLWRALGDARRAARFENSAGAAYRRAAELGIDEPQALLLAGLHARAQGDTPNAAAWLLRASDADPAHADPLVGFVADAALGETLIELGYLAAGADALARGVEIPDVARVPTQVGREAADIQRRLGPLRIALGDALLRLGRNAQAARVYEQARGRPGAEGVRERLIYAFRTSGNDAAAALVLLDEVRESARVAPDTARLLGELAESIKPRTLIADALASLDDRGSAARRADLLTARALALPAPRALDLLAAALESPEGFSSVEIRELLGAGLAIARDAHNSGKPASALRWAGSLVNQQPRLAPHAAAALIHTEGFPTDLAAALKTALKSAAKSGSRDAAPAIAAELALLRNDHDAIRAALAEPAESGENAPSPPALARTARLAARVGAWDRLDAAIAALRDTGDARALAAALIAAQRSGDALAVLKASKPRTIDGYLSRSALEVLAGETGSALADLEAARDLDPLDERVYAALLAFHAPDGPMPDDDATTAVGRQLRQVLPESGLLRTMLAGELLRRGLIDDAAAITLPLFEADPTDQARQDAVLNLWRRRAAADRAGENELEILRTLRAAYPNDPGLVRVLVGGLALAGEYQAAVDEIAAFADAAGDRTLSALREQLIRDGLDDPERAESLALARLAPAPRSIDASVELMGLHAGAMTREGVSIQRTDAMRDAAEDIPESAVLSLAQRAAAVSSVARAAVAMDAARRQSPGNRLDRNAQASMSVGPLVDLLGWAASRDLELAPGIHELRLVLLDEQGASAGAIIDATEHALAQHTGSETLRRAFLRRAAGILLARDEPDSAFAWLADQTIEKPVSETDPVLDPDAFQEWFRLVIVVAQDNPAASIDRARDMLDRLAAAGVAPAAWEVVRPEGPSWSVPKTPGEETPDETAADLAYLLALYAPDPDGTGAARTAFLRLALEKDPAHAWAANDLGYTMLEAGPEAGTDQGERLAEAERLIEIAYAGAPNEANIVDSLGWVRYHRGKLEDETDPETGEIEPGAITLLRKAVELSESDDDGVVHDHLGDALYAAGRTDEAIEAWRQAARLANAALSRLRAAGQTGGIRSDQIADLAVKAIMKPNAIKLDQRPAVEPQRGLPPRDEPPTPDPQTTQNSTTEGEGDQTPAP